MSTGLFSIARGALLTHQTSLQTISQNIANAETPGYSRQEAQLVANTPVQMPFGNIGTGVHVETIIRKRNLLLDENYREAASLAGEANVKQGIMSHVESIFGEPTDAGMTSALDQFWSAWSDLSAAPTSGAAKAVVQQRGRQVAQLLNTYDTQLTQTRSATIESMASVVGEINTYAQQVAALNGQILTTESNGQPANDLRDQRDLLADKLATLAGGRVIQQNNGSTSILIGNSTLVDGTTISPLSIRFEVQTPPPAVTPGDIPVRIQLGNSPDRLAPLGGELKALVDVVNTEIPTLRARLDGLASALVSSVNAVHTTGFVFNGTTIPGTAAGNFFDAGTVLNPVRASTITLDSAIANDASLIAVSGDINAPSDNTVGIAMSALRTKNDSVTYTTGGSTETASLLGFFRNTVTSLGLKVSNAQDSTSMYETLSAQINARRQSVSGVSVDEELVNLMRVQQSYTAATKLIQTADEMLQTLLQMV
jgi:flagellar hook-associated protein 1 FlgK